MSVVISRIARGSRRRMHGGITIVSEYKDTRETSGEFIFDTSKPHTVVAPIADFLLSLVEDPSRIDSLTEADFFTPEEAKTALLEFDADQWRKDRELLELSDDEALAQGVNADEIISRYNKFRSYPDGFEAPELGEEQVAAIRADYRRMELEQIDVWYPSITTVWGHTRVDKSEQPIVSAPLPVFLYELSKDPNRVDTLTDEDILTREEAQRALAVFDPEQWERDKAELVLCNKDTDPMRNRYIEICERYTFRTLNIS